MRDTGNKAEGKAGNMDTTELSGKMKAEDEESFGALSYRHKGAIVLLEWLKEVSSLFLHA
jgi:hypothetical protein